MASTTKSVSEGFTAVLMAVISCIIASSTARRPAVSTITTLNACWRAYFMAFSAICTGSLLPSSVYTSTPICPPSTFSWSMDVRRRAAHQQGQLVAYDLGHHLAGLHRLQYVLPQRLLLHFVGERLGYLVVDVGVDQRTANLLEGFGDVDLRDAALAFEDFERPFEFIR